MFGERILGKSGRQAILYALSLGGAKGISLLMVPVFTAALTPAQFGTLEVLTAFADVGGLLVGFGLADALFRFAAPTTDGRRQAAVIFGLSLIVAAAALIGGQLAAPVLTGWLPAAATVPDLRLMSWSLALTACLQVPLAWLRMSDRAGLFCLASLGKAMAQAVMVALALRAGLGVTGVLMAGAVADTVLAGLLVAQQYRATGLVFAPTALRRIGLYSLPLVVGGLAGFAMGSFDRWLLAALRSAAETATYGLAAKFSLAVAFLIQPFEMWWYPRRLALLREAGGGARSAAIVHGGIALAALSATVCCLVLPPLIRALTPEAYHAAAGFAPWLCLAIGLQAAGSLVNAGCYSRATGLWPLTINGTGAVTAMVGYALLIPDHGAWGAITATVAAQVVRLVLFYLIAQRLEPLPLAPGRIAAVGLAALAVPWLSVREASAEMLAVVVFGVMVLAFGLLPRRAASAA